MKNNVPTLSISRKTFISSKDIILNQWLSYKSIEDILNLHSIDKAFFLGKYASGVFDYFMEVIDNKTDLRNCPVMEELLPYLKNSDISVDELYIICSNFRCSIIDFTYDIGINSKELLNEISFIFDKNFRGILKFYTDNIFQRLIDAKKDVDMASQAKELFLSNMSHEIRTPLNAILGFVNLLIEENISKKHKKYLELILNSGENLLSIINDILDFSKLRSGEFTIEPKIFSVHDEISHTMELFIASANVKEITITSFIDPHIPKELYADSLRIKQILSNFLSNAIKFTPIGGHIMVEAFYHDSILKVSVKDNGRGIAKKDMKNIFTAFSQAQHSVEDNINGTGLGLCISHQLAKHMNGCINVKSVLGSGSTFWMDLPVEAYTTNCPLYDDVDEFKSLKIVVYSKNTKDVYKEESFMRYANVFNMNAKIVDNIDDEFDIALFVEGNVDKSFIAKAISSNKKFIVIVNQENDIYNKYDNITSITFPLYCSKIRDTFNELLNPNSYIPHRHKANKLFTGHILVAEDNETNQELIKILLKKYGLTYDLAKNGQEAVALYQRNNYDMVLMDEQMPVMNGNEAVKKILDYELKNAKKHTPISALTANVIKGAKERGLLSGYDSFLGKPVSLVELERIFTKYLQIKSASSLAQVDENSKKTIQGIDAKELKKELMLSTDELIMLLDLYLNKMRVQIPKLSDFIDKKDYEKIAFNAHSIKGSSGNFRIESIQQDANEMEKMAKTKNVDYNYKEALERIKKRVEEIKIK